MPDSLTISREWMELLNGISDVEERWIVLSAVFEFANSDKADTTDRTDGLSPIGKSAFMTIKKKINLRKRVARFYTKRKDGALESNGKIVRIKRKNLTEKALESNAYDLFPETSNQHSITNISPNCIDKSIHTSPTGENSTARRVFKVPSLDEVKSYVREKGYSVDPEEFYSYYSSQGWRVGRNPMRDWRRAISYWQCRINNRNKTRSQLRDYSGI